MEGLTLQVEIIPSLVEATWHVQAVSWNLHVDYKLAINSLLFFQKSLVSAINCLPLHLSPASSLPSRCIFGISCAASIVSRSPATPEGRKITLRLHVFHTSFLLCIDVYIYIMHTQIHTYIYIYIRTQMNKSISRCHPWQQRVPSSSSSSSMMESISAHDSLLVDPLRAAKLTWKVIPLTK